MSLSGSSPHRGLRSSTNSTTMHIIFLLIWLVLMLFVLSLASQVVRAHKRPAANNYQNLRRKFQRLRQFKFHAKVSKAGFRSPGYAGAWHQLLRLVQFDVATAERLVSGYQRKHPGKPDRWYIEKAIYDLERDRH